MTREDALQAITDNLGSDAALRIHEFDSITYHFVAAQLEDEHDVRLPERFVQLQPPPPYRSVEAFADALVASSVERKCTAESNVSGGDRG